MNGIFWAIIAEVLIGASLVVDKLLLEDKPGRMLPYVFWIGVLNAFAFLLIPFGFALPTGSAALFSLGAGVSFLLTQICIYGALTRGGATSTLPIIGGFSPVATYLLSSFVVFMPLNIADKVAFVLLVLGGFLLFFSEKVDIKKLLPWVLGAAFFTGVMDVLQRLAFFEGSFTSIFVTIKAFTFLTALSLLLIPRFRKSIFSSTHEIHRGNQFLYLGNRLASGIGSFLIFYAFSQTPQPALIESLSGFRYVIIFIVVFALSKFHPAWIKERLRGWSLAAKIIATVLIAAALAGLSSQKYYERVAPTPADKISWGVTFSEQMSKHLGLDWQENLKAIITDLKPKTIRLIAYWDDIEPEAGKYDYTDLDWQMNEAKKSGVPTTLVVGEKTPRWPECHFPTWLTVSDYNLRRGHLLSYVQKTVDRYKNYPNLVNIQVENEPFLIFGSCPQADSKLVEDEVALVRRLSPGKKIILTDGGEFGDWYRASKLADIFGPTLYRKVHTRLFGYITWPITPQFYPLRRDVIRFLTGKTDQKFFISELGLEPWMVKQIYEVDIPTQLSFFGPEDFRNVISYARQTTFTDFDAWGAEWWYYMKKHGDPRFWDMAKNVFAGQNP